MLRRGPTILKEYFMDLGSFPEDQKISATALSGIVQTR